MTLQTELFQQQQSLPGFGTDTVNLVCGYSLDAFGDLEYVSLAYHQGKRLVWFIDLDQHGGADIEPIRAPIVEPPLPTLRRVDHEDATDADEQTSRQ